MPGHVAILGLTQFLTPRGQTFFSIVQSTSDSSNMSIWWMAYPIDFFAPDMEIEENGSTSISENCSKSIPRTVPKSIPAKAPRSSTCQSGSGAAKALSEIVAEPCSSTTDRVASLLKPWMKKVVCVYAVYTYECICLKIQKHIYT